MVSIFQLVCKCTHLSRVGDAVIKLYPEECMKSLMAFMVIIIKIQQEWNFLLSRSSEGALRVRKH